MSHTSPHPSSLFETRLSSLEVVLFLRLESHGRSWRINQQNNTRSSLYRFTDKMARQKIETNDTKLVFVKFPANQRGAKKLFFQKKEGLLEFFFEKKCSDILKERAITQVEQMICTSVWQRASTISRVLTLMPLLKTLSRTRFVARAFQVQVFGTMHTPATPFSVCLHPFSRFCVCQCVCSPQG